MKTNHKQLLRIILFVALLGGSSLILAGISATKHNLSVSGPGTYKATSEQQICVFCHAPHNASPTAALWNRNLSTVATYTPYSSTTMKAAAPGQPTGASKLCLACHDGTVALGSVLNMPLGHMQPGTVAGLTSALLGTASTNLGTDLRNDHPISFTYDTALSTANPELVNPATLTGKIKPISGQMQCTSCHDPHSDSPPKFMLTGYQSGGYGSPLCLTCHNKTGWANSGHRNSTRTWSGATIAPWGQNPFHIVGQDVVGDSVNSTPKANGCETCHQPHTISGNNYLLKRPGGTTYNQSYLCLNCHNGTSGLAQSDKDIWNKMNQVSHHPSADNAYNNRHLPKRNATLNGVPDTSGKVREDQANFANANRHAECMDCHNPHMAYGGSSPDVSTTANLTTSIAPPVLNGAWGVTPNNWGSATAWTAKDSEAVGVGSANQYSGYTIIDNVGDGTHFTYQLCFKCHSSWAFGTSPPPDISNRLAGGLMTDVAREYNPNNKSYHPSNGNPGKNCFKKGGTLANNGCGTGVDYSRALLIGGTANPKDVEINCIDCHSNKDPLSSPGVGAKGPHGSATAPILWAPYTDDTGISTTATHMCFKCHDFTIYVSGGQTDQDGTGYSTKTKNLHGYHVGQRDYPCTTCHSALPHGMPNRHLIVFGTANAPGDRSAKPYLNHERVVNYNKGGDFGVPAEVGASGGLNLDTIASGEWDGAYCHASSTNDVGTCR